MHPHHHHHYDHHQMMVGDFKRRLFVSIFLTIPILYLSPSMLTTEMDHSLAKSIGLLIISTCLYLYGGWPFLTGLIGEVRARNPGMMTLIGVALSTAYAYSIAILFGLKGMPLFWELATLIDIMLLGHWIEMRSVMGAGRALEELSHLIPDTAERLVEGDQTEHVPLSSLRQGDKLLIKPGSKIPADGQIIKGISELDESLLTGESLPVHKGVGDAVIGGSMNGAGALIIRVGKLGEDSFLYGVIKLVKAAQAVKSTTQVLADKAAFWLTIIALGGGALTFVYWMLIPVGTLAFAMERMVTVMVITCPHALGLAIPLVVAMSTSLGAAHGLLIRNRSIFELARNTQAILFDKTGTLTQGQFGVTGVVVLNKAFNDKDIIGYAAAVEQYSEHPIAKAIQDKAAEIWPVDQFKAIPGKGAEGIVNGHKVHVVSPGYLKTLGIEVPTSLSNEGKTVVYVLIDENLIGAIALADQIRPASITAIKQLKSMGIRCIMLTGDNTHVAHSVARQIGIEEVFAEVLPGDKVQKIKEIQSRGLVTMMVGDGVNDAPALAQADIGVAIGAGTDIAIETADIILVKSNPQDVVALIELARRTYAKMIQNLVWATGYNIIAIPAAAGVFASAGLILQPAVGAVLMSLSTIICAVNAQLLRYSTTVEPHHTP